MAIDKYLYITIKPDSFDRKYKLRYSQVEIVENIYDLKHTRAKEALFLHEVGPVEINTCADLQSNSGMGSSGSFLVGLLKALREYKGADSSPMILADEACKIEIDVLKEPVGKQDQYIAAYGDVRIFQILKDGTVQVGKIEGVEDLIPNMRVYSLNQFRNASDILSDQQKNACGVRKVLDKVKDFGYKTIHLLNCCKYDEYGLLLDEYWQLKKQLSLKISLPIVDDIYEEVKKNYNVLGGKIIGAGGGGFLLLYVPEGHEKLDRFMSCLGMKRLNYSIGSGSKLLGNFL